MCFVYSCICLFLGVLLSVNGVSCTCVGLILDVVYGFTLLWDTCFREGWFW